MKEVPSHIIAQLWKLAADESSPAQTAALRELIRSDEAVAAAWQEIEFTQQSLRTWTPEQPSMRFQQQVLERLPATRQVEELLPVWARWLVATGFMVAFLPVLARLGASAGGSSYSKPLQKLELVLENTGIPHWLSSWEWPVLETALTPSVVLYLALAGVGLSILLAVDRMVQRLR